MNINFETPQLMFKLTKYLEKNLIFIIMGTKFSISEQEKNDIKSMYGLINEQQCSLTQSDINLQKF